MDEVLGSRASVDPHHMLESGAHITVINGSPDVERDSQEKEALDEEIYITSQNQRERLT